MGQSVTKKKTISQKSGSGLFGTKGADIASVTTTDLYASGGDYNHITGTTTITSLGTAPAGYEKKIVFDGILTLTHNGTSLILPGAANIITSAGDSALFVSEGSGNWKCMFYQRYLEDYIDFASTITGFASAPAYICKYKMLTSNTYHFILRPSIATSNATTCTFTLPFNHPNYAGLAIPVWMYDNSTSQIGYMQTATLSNVVSIFKGAGTGWTATGSKCFNIDVVLPI